MYFEHIFPIIFSLAVMENLPYVNTSLCEHMSLYQYVDI